MKKLLFLALLAMMSLALSAPVALAQDYDDDDGASSASAVADDDDGVRDYDDDDGVRDYDDDDGVGATSSSATVSSSATAAPDDDDDGGRDDDDGAAATASPAQLPETGGTSFLALAAATLLLGSGILSLRLLRRDS